MKTIFQYVTAASIPVNLFYLGLWLYVFNSYQTQKERVNAFIVFLPLDLPVFFLSTFLLIITIVSIVFLLRNYVRNNAFWRALIPIQLFFALLYLWQKM